MIRALILDLDNTIYPVTSIGDILFKPLFDLLEEHKQEIGEDDLPEIKKLLMKKAWQKIAEQYEFNDELNTKGADILRELAYNGPMQAFDDYALVKDIAADKYLVTMGFTKMQQAKVDMLNLKVDFKEIFINDQEKEPKTKKDIFAEILSKYEYKPNEVLVIGDDPDSEIEAGNDLQIPTVLYDKQDEYPDAPANHRIKHYNELAAIIQSYNN